MTALPAAVRAADAVPLVVGPHGGLVGGIAVQRTYANAASIEFDALVVVGEVPAAPDAMVSGDAKSGAVDSVSDPRVVKLLAEAWRHAKAIGASGGDGARRGRNHTRGRGRRHRHRQTRRHDTAQAARRPPVLGTVRHQPGQVSRRTSLERRATMGSVRLAEQRHATLHGAVRSIGDGDRSTVSGKRTHRCRRRRARRRGSRARRSPGRLRDRGQRRNPRSRSRKGSPGWLSPGITTLWWISLDATSLRLRAAVRVLPLARRRAWAVDLVNASGRLPAAAMPSGSAGAEGPRSANHLDGRRDCFVVGDELAGAGTCPRLRPSSGLSSAR